MLSMPLAHRTVSCPSTKWGHSAIVNTSGNGDCHIILRGGKEPNYSAAHVKEVKEGLAKAGLPAQGDDRLQPRQQQQAV
ncbi:Phospho-2-dehydro-3-deoxyheptonate aldolase, Phe-sensitive [Serratia fonticola]|uniref:3-deoxy-D-arabino-heptulosonate 7-phosphate synthase n=1 Tax=Serratia fonticola TaxID=47917 RepID=A0A4U9UK87_SERFO|nr:Phospho-2-dehydro-3-deoxyheptonate aldolase, Phe-sensitive [Serratia fonticola]